MAKMTDINVGSSTELISALTAIDISVPARTEKRTRDHTERWSICRLLATFASHKQFHYPMQLYHKDKPDFRLICGQSKIGVEVTEAIPQNLAAADALAEKEKPSASLDISKLKWGEKNKSARELRKIMAENRLTGPGWVDDEPEKEWSQSILDTCRKKTEKLRAPGFDKFDHNWLLIHDNLAPPIREVDRSLKYLIEKLADYWHESVIYDSVLIETWTEIIRINRNSNQRWNINNIWVSA